jgi:hypothetical protein
LLARAGFATVDRKAYYTLASLHNHGLFRAGALLIGSHAFGALLNALGVRAVPYATEDVDIARREALALPGVTGFLEMLRATGIEFFAVPSLNRRTPATSFAEPGGARLRVDLLVPSTNDDYPTIPVPELKAHAKGLPYLAYLLGASQEVPVLSSHGAVMVRTPVPERYAIHKRSGGTYLGRALAITRALGTARTPHGNRRNRGNLARDDRVDLLHVAGKHCDDPAIALCTVGLAGSCGISLAATLGDSVFGRGGAARGLVCESRPRALCSGPLAMRGLGAPTFPGRLSMWSTWRQRPVKVTQWMDCDSL